MGHFSIKYLESGFGGRQERVYPLRIKQARLVSPRDSVAHVLG
jgi:hypothetical protein